MNTLHDHIFRKVFDVLFPVFIFSFLFITSTQLLFAEPYEGAYGLHATAMRGPTDTEIKLQVTTSDEANWPLPDQLEKLQVKQAQMENELADPAIYNVENKDKMLKLVEQKNEIDRQCEELEMQWLESSEELELMREKMAS